MTRRPRLFPLALAVAMCATTLAGSAPAKSGAYGEYVRAARMLRDWRYDEANERIERLAKKYPKAPETKYLEAEMAFLEGDYPRSLQLLDGLDDGDLQHQVGKLRELVASTMQVTDGYERRESSGGHFVIYFPRGKEEVIVDLAGDVLERAYAALGEDLGYRPPESIRVEILTEPEDLARASALTVEEIRTSGTIALCKYGKLMVVTPRATVFGYPWMDTLAHEYTHYVVSRMSHDTVPVWLQEGLAKYLQARWRSDHGEVLTRTDEYLLANALKKRRLISFEAMHPSMALLPSQEAVALAFAEVHTMVAFIHTQAGSDGLRRIIEKQRDGKSAYRAVSEVLDTRWKKVYRGWRQYLRNSKLRASRAIASRATSPRIRFEKGGKKGENIGIEEVPNAQARKHTRLGGLLRSRGMSDAAAVEYEKALALTGRENLFVASKLSRTYLELGQLDKAIELAEPLMEVDPGDAVPATTVAVAELANGNPKRARAGFEIALRVSPFDPAVRCGLAEVYSALGEKALAEREQKACKRLRP